MAKLKIKKKKSGDKKKCNVCESKMNARDIYICSKCGNTGETETCNACYAKMDMVKLYICPSCGNTIDERLLKEKENLKKKFEDLT